MMTGIQWTEETWNPTTGCDQVSPGCDNCYALTMARRLKGMGQAKYQRDGNPDTSGQGFGVSVHPDELTAPLRWRKPRTVFVDSMGDLFHDAVPDEFITRVWAVMAATPQHTYQILTKRHGRMRSLLRDECRCSGGHAPGIHFRSRMSDVARSIPGVDSHAVYFDAPWPLPNVWLGVSVEDQKRAELRIPALCETPAAVRFLSCEPLIGPVDLDRWLTPWPGWCQECGARMVPGSGTWCRSCETTDADYSSTPRRRLDWVIIGGESGSGARPCDPAWVRDLAEQCQDAGLPVFVKQMGSDWARRHGTDTKGGNPETWPADLRVREFPNVVTGGARVG